MVKTELSGGLLNSSLNKKQFLIPEIEIEELLKKDVILMSDGFNGQGDYDPEDEWLN